MDGMFGIELNGVMEGGAHQPHHHREESMDDDMDSNTYQDVADVSEIRKINIRKSQKLIRNLNK